MSKDFFNKSDPRILSNCITCNDLKLDQMITIIIDDVVIFDDIITTANLTKIKKYICDGCKYYIR